MYSLFGPKMGSFGPHFWVIRGPNFGAKVPKLGEKWLKIGPFSAGRLIYSVFQVTL